MPTAYTHLHSGWLQCIWNSCVASHGMNGTSLIAGWEILAQQIQCRRSVDIRAVPNPLLCQKKARALFPFWPIVLASSEQAQGANSLLLAMGSFLPGKVSCSSGSRENKSFFLALHGARCGFASSSVEYSTPVHNKDVAMTAYADRTVLLHPITNMWHCINTTGSPLVWWPKKTLLKIMLQRLKWNNKIMSVTLHEAVIFSWAS